MSDTPQLSLVLACYNEAEHLETSFSTILATLAQLRCTSEILLIDDASRDATPEIIRRITAGRSECRTIFHGKNMGRGATVAEGLRAARGRFAGYLDVDLEVSACYMVEAMRMLDSGVADVAVGRRTYKLQITPRSLVRHVVHRAYRGLVHRLLPLPASDSEAGYKFFHREKILPVLDRVKDPGWFWDTEVLVRAVEAGLRIGEFHCLFMRNPGKTSTVRVWRDSVEYLRQVQRLRQEIRSERRLSPSAETRHVAE